MLSSLGFVHTVAADMHKIDGGRREGADQEREIDSHKTFLCIKRGY